MAVTEELDMSLDNARRAAHAERQQHPADWPGIAEEVMRRARSIRVPDEPVLVEVTADGGRTVASTRVLLVAIRRLLFAQASYAPYDISFRVADERLRGIEVKLVAAYGVDLLAVAESARTAVAGRLRELLGRDGPPVEVDVAIVDVVLGDPRVV